MSEMTHDKVSDLMARMRTCASFLLYSDLLVDLELRHDMAEHAGVKDAAALLIEAASALEKLNPPPEPMEIIPPPPENFAIDRTPQKHWKNPYKEAIDRINRATDKEIWTDPGVPASSAHPVSRNACPKCDSRAAKTVHRVDNRLELECPVCGTRWNYNAGTAKWI